MEKPVLLEIEFTHECWCIDSAEKSEAVARMLYHGTPIKGTVSGLIEVKSPDLNKTLECLKKESGIVEARIISKDVGIALIFIRHKKNTLMAEAVEKVNCIPFLPSLTRDGKDNLLILAPTSKALPELKSLLKEQCSYYNLRFKRYVDKPFKTGYSEYLKLNTIASQLTQKQVEAFSLACKNGYYDNPKKTSLEELAYESGISKSTLAEHLRKVESKILPVMGEITRY
jgi:predicted DNA binding protein